MSLSLSPSFHPSLLLSLSLSLSLPFSRCHSLSLFLSLSLSLLISLIYCLSPPITLLPLPLWVRVSHPFYGNIYKCMQIYKSIYNVVLTYLCNWKCSHCYACHWNKMFFYSLGDRISEGRTPKCICSNVDCWNSHLRKPGAFEIRKPRLEPIMSLTFSIWCKPMCLKQI